MSQIAVIGLGYVGLTTAACFADLGHQVAGQDIDEPRVARLRRNQVPFFEPGLVEVVERNARAGRLTFTTSLKEAMTGAEFVFLAVNTPPDRHGGADLSALRAAVTSIGKELDHPLVIVNKSTVPIGTGDLVTQLVNASRQAEIEFSVVSNPSSCAREARSWTSCSRTGWSSAHTTARRRPPSPACTRRSTPTCS